MKHMENGADLGFGWASAAPTSANAYILPAVVKFLPLGKPGKLLDVGCGNGFITQKLHEIGYQVVGIDASQDGIEIARASYPAIRFEIYSIYKDLCSIIPEVDVVVSTEVIEHLYNPIAFVKNIYNVLRPDGVFILSTPYHGYLKNLMLSLFNAWDKHFHVEKTGGHIKFFSQQSLTTLLTQVGFHNIQFLYVGRVRWLWKSMVCRCEKP